MGNYIIYDNKTGVIAHNGYGSIEDMRGLLTEGQEIMSGHAELFTDLVDVDTKEVLRGVTSRTIGYVENRYKAYPDRSGFLDAQVKLSSSDTTTQAEGQAQLDTYYADCLEVKARFPKE